MERNPVTGCCSRAYERPALSITLLRTLVHVADLRTFSAAATAARVTHAAVSQQMRKLEADLGVPLFERSGRTPTLTPLGRAVAERARGIVADYDGLLPSVLGEDGLSGEVTFGAVPTTLTGLAPRAMSLLRGRAPDLRVRIRPGLTSELMAETERGLADVALVSRPALMPAGLAFLPVAEEPLHLIAAEGAEGDDPEALLVARPFIRFKRDAVVGTLIEAWIQSRGLRVSEAMELDTLEAISSMVSVDLGVSIVPRLCVPAHPALPLRRIPLPDAPVRLLGLAHRASDPRMRVVEEVHAALLAAVEAA